MSRIGEALKAMGEGIQSVADGQTGADIGQFLNRGRAELAQALQAFPDSIRPVEVLGREPGGKEAEIEGPEIDAPEMEPPDLEMEME